MDIKYVYVKPRIEFGKQCFFEDIGPNIEENIFPDPSFTNEYIQRWMINKYTQKSKQLSLHEVQTETKKMKCTGMTHLQGGWPKEINTWDDEAIRRYQRRVTKTDSWYWTMTSLMKTMEYYIKQNNTVNIHGYYFDDMVPTELKISPNLRIVNVYSDQESVVRPANYVSWSMITNQLAVAYCSKDRIQLPSNFSPNACIWDPELTIKPLMVLKSTSASVVIEFNPRDPLQLISGLMSGQVCSWDTRTGDSPVQISEPLLSHRNPASQAFWISSKTNTEFFTSSNSGTVKWWDTRSLRGPTDVLVMDVDEPNRGDLNSAIGIASLQYEPTVGSRFLAGLDNGIVVNVNRRAVTTYEKLQTRFNCHLGAVVSVDRNPGSLKNFLTVGGWQAKVWTEETRESCLRQTARRGMSRPTGGCWSRSRLSLFFTIDTAGRLNAYDILQGTAQPLFDTRLSNKALTTIKPHDDGRLLAVGSADGNVYIVECQGLLSTTFPNDKQFYTTYMERCSRYQRSADTRHREVRMVISKMGLQSKTEIIPVARTNKEKAKEAREKARAKEAAEREKQKAKEKEKETPRRSRTKKSTYHEYPFSNDMTLMEAEKHYFMMIYRERQKYDTDENREIEDLYKLHRRVEEEELEAKGIGDQEDDSGKDEKAKRMRQRRRKKRKSPSTRFKIIDTLQQSSGMIDVDSIKSEEMMGMSGKKRRTLSEIPLKICPMGVCKPEICCLDVLKAEREKRKLRKAEEERKRRKTRFIDSDEDIQKPKVLVSAQEWQKWQSKASAAKRGIPERTPLQKRKILINKDAPPAILTQDVLNAKKHLEAWRESLSLRKGSSRRSLSALPKMQTEKEKDAKKGLEKKARSVLDLASSETVLSFDDLSTVSFNAAEVESNLLVTSSKTQQLLYRDIKTEEKGETEVYPRISEAYFPKYPD